MEFFIFGQATSNTAAEFLTVIDMKHISNGKDQTISAAFRAKRRFLNLMMQEEETLNINRINKALKSRTEYQSQTSEKVINFIIPLSGRLVANFFFQNTVPSHHKHTHNKFFSY